MTEEEIDRLTSRLFVRLGLPVNRAGCRYLRCAMYILLGADCPTRLELKELYWHIARRCHTTEAGVEGTIRRTIDTVCYQGDLEVLSECFGKEDYHDDVRPTPTEFVMAIRDKLRSMYYGHL
ncbi:MAG: sporulation initiation factor Spo0A C-terminal domain-containing protein [Clostridia bacterium]|nr:sporulation initiation factor Spo0A C-terminal domain-containing protein [Clostridia bacterium]